MLVQSLPRVEARARQGVFDGKIAVRRGHDGQSVAAGGAQDVVRVVVAARLERLAQLGVDKPDETHRGGF